MDAQLYFIPVPRRYLEDRRRCGRQPTNDPIIADTLAKAVRPILYGLFNVLGEAMWERSGRKLRE